MEEQKEARVNLIADAGLRNAAYVNTAFAKSTPKESYLSFALVDSEADVDGELVAEGILQAHIVMSHDTLVEVRDMLDAHIKANLEKAE